MNPSPEDHGMRRLLLPLALGFLDEAAETAAEEHLQQCDDCQELYAALVEDPESRGERHLPSAMLATWGRARRSLQGLERQAVSSHLERCDDCRADLTALGYEPSLDLLSAPGTAAPEKARFSLSGWLLGGIGGFTAGALAAVVAVMMLGPGRTPEVDPLESVPWVAPSRTRGGPSQLELPAGSRQLMLTLAVPSGLDASAEAEVEVKGPDGNVLQITSIAPGLRAAGTVLVLLHSPQPLEPGSYEVRFGRPGEPGEVTRFELRSGG